MDSISISTVNKLRSRYEKSLAEPGFEPGANGWEAQTLPLYYAAPRKCLVLLNTFDHRWQSKFKRWNGRGMGKKVLKFLIIDWQTIDDKPRSDDYHFLSYATIESTCDGDRHLAGNVTELKRRSLREKFPEKKSVCGQGCQLSFQQQLHNDNDNNDDNNDDNDDDDNKLATFFLLYFYSLTTGHLMNPASSRSNYFTAHPIQVFMHHSL